MLAEIFAKSLRNLLLPDIIKLFLLCLVVYGIGMFAMSAGFSTLIGVYAGLNSTEGFIAGLLGSASGMVLAWFLFPLLYPVLISFFDDRMAVVIERDDYPQLPAAEPPFWPTLWHDAVFCLKALGINLLCLPFYFIPLLGLLLYYGINGYLLGTQFFRMAAGRRAGPEQVKALQAKAGSKIILAGAAISFCSTIPLLNLAAPLLGVAIMLHLFHALAGNDKQQVLPQQGSPL